MLQGFFGLQINRVSLSRALLLVGCLSLLGASSWAAATNYVSLDGSHASPYDTWEKAATNIQAAIDAASAGDTVIVSNGTYYATNGHISTITSEGAVVAKGITVKSLNGREQTLVHGAGLASAIFTLSHTNAVLDGFTLTNGVKRGLVLTNGTVYNCTIISNTMTGATAGGGVYARANTLVANSRILYNNFSDARAGGGGAGGGGTFYNCLIAYNTSKEKTAGATGVTLINCTVVSNSSASAVGNHGGADRCSLTNCIVFSNSPGNIYVVSNEQNKISYTLSSPLIPGEGNIDADPQFVDATNGDFRLKFGSPAIDSGTNLAVITDDLEGNLRPQNGNGLLARHDMGCYEAADYTTGDLGCWEQVTPATGWETVTATCEAVIGGDPTVTNINEYSWDFGDGSPLGSGANVQHVFNSPGRYNVKLTVKNSLATTAEACCPVLVGTESAYVTEGGAGAFPYASWDQAAGSIQDAVNSVQAACDGGAPNPCVWVSNGTYAIDSAICISKGVRVQSVMGRDYTVIVPVATNQMNVNIISLHYPEAVVSGFTLSNGTARGVYMTDGTLANCTVISNRSPYQSCGAGILMLGGLITNCLIIQNKSDWYGGGAWLDSGNMVDSICSENSSTRHGGGVYALNNSALSRCKIIKNSVSDNNHLGAGLWLNNSSANNCLIISNYTAGNAAVSGGLLVNCTVVSNTCAKSASAGASTCKLTNCIVYYNYNSAGVSSNLGAGCSGSYNCTIDPLLAGTGNITNDPLFVDFDGGDFHLSKDSPARAAGTTNGIVDAKDLDGNPRTLRNKIDLGCYQWMPPRGTLYSTW